MRILSVPDLPTAPNMSLVLSDRDTMYDGRDGHYVSVALSAMRAVEAALDGKPAPRKILDLPCGHGRVTRVLRARYPDAAITACDIDRDGVDFVAANFRARPFYSVQDFRSLNLRDKYDLIWVGSLVTHLSEQQTASFFMAMRRHMAPGAILLVSTHGPAIISGLRSWGYGLTPDDASGTIEDYERTGYGYRNYPGGRDYGISLTNEQKLREILSHSGLSLDQYWVRAWDDHQDIAAISVRRTQPFETLKARLLGRLRAPAVQHEAIAASQLAVLPKGAESASVSSLQHQVGGSNDYAFDENWYCRTYADVHAAVDAAAFTSGHDHYVQFGRAEGRFPCAHAEEDSRTGRNMYPSGERQLTEEERRDRVGAVWSVHPEHAAGWYWMAHPMVRARLNVMASGSPEADSYGRLAELLLERGVTLPIPRAVSLGCGFGGLERDLASRGIIHEIDGYDIAPGAIAEAQRLAREGGFDGLRYHIADLETEVVAPGAVDVVFAHQSVHHVERLEQLFTAVSSMLKPSGIFHLHEFVGPDRFQWTDMQIREVNRFIDALPPRLRALPLGKPKPRQDRATVAAMIAADPSEAVRSSEIIAILRQHFDILEERALGGALLHLGLGDIAQNFDSNILEDRLALEAFFAAEDAAMRDGLIGSDFAVITAAKRSMTSAV